MIDWIGNDYTQSILDAAADFCRERDHSLAVFTLGHLSYTLDALPLEKQVRPFIDSPEIDRILVCDAQMVRERGAESLRQVFSRPVGKPVLFFGERVADWPVWAPQTESAFPLLLDHLVRVHGYRRLAWVSGPPDNPDSRGREKALRKFLDENQLSLDPDLVVRGDFNLATGRDAARVLAPLRDRFDAVVCANDTMAIGIREILGPDVPVTGFDNDSAAVKLALTTIDADVGRQVRQALAVLWEGGERSTVPAGRLVVRTSCGCPRTNTEESPTPSRAEKFTERVGGLFERILECEDLSELTSELDPALATEGIRFWSLIPPDSNETEVRVFRRWLPESTEPTLVVIHSLFREKDLFGYFVHDLRQRDYVFSEWLRLNLCLLFPAWQRRHQSVHIQKVLGIELEKFEKRRREVESVVDSLPIWIVEVDRRLIVRYMNRSLRHLLGLGESEGRLQPLSSFLAPVDREKVENRAFEGLKLQTSVGLDFRFLSRDKREVPVIAEAQCLPSETRSNLATLFGSMHFGGGLRFTGLSVRPIIDGVSQPEQSILKHFPFSPGEKDVITWLARGMDTSEIAKQLHRAESTVRVQLHNIYSKTGVGRRKEFLELLRDYRARTDPPHSLTQVLLARLFQSTPSS